MYPQYSYITLYTYIYIFVLIFARKLTSSTAQGGGGSFRIGNL